MSPDLAVHPAPGAAVAARASGLVALVSMHRFRLTLGACLLALGLMLVTIHATVGLGPPLGSSVLRPG